MKTRLILFLMFLPVLGFAQTYTFSTLASFPPASKKGPAYPSSNMVMDPAGNFFGVSAHGGANNEGTVFKVTPKGVITVLHSFDGSDGLPIIGSLTRDTAGNLYGSASQGGTTSCSIVGCGTVFKLTANATGTYTFSVLYSAAVGQEPGGVALDSAGNLYAVSVDSGGFGEGDVFEIAPDGVFSDLYNFCSLPNCTDGSVASGGVIIDKAGNLYGPTNIGGEFNQGTVFELTPELVETVLYNFTGGIDGDLPQGKMTQDAQGNKYGSTLFGGLGGGELCLSSRPRGAFLCSTTFVPKAAVRTGSNLRARHWMRRATCTERPRAAQQGSGSCTKSHLRDKRPCFTLLGCPAEEQML